MYTERKSGGSYGIWSPGPVSAVGSSSGSWVYSYRTGFKGGIDYVPGLEYTDDLVSNLTRRKTFYEDLQRALSENHTSYPTDTRVYTVDRGHSFCSIKTDGAVQTSTLVDKSGKVLQRLAGSVSAAIVPKFFIQPTITSGSATSYDGVDFGPSVAPVRPIQVMMDRMVPRGAAIGETIVELVRGDIPSVLTSVRSAVNRAQSNSRLVETLRRSQSPAEFDALTKIILSNPNSKPRWLKSSGKDFLEVQFGMLPLLTSILNAVSVLARVTDALYGHSFRRQDKSLMPEYDFFRSRTIGENRTAYYGGFPGRFNVIGPVAPGGEDAYGSLDVRVSLRATLNGRPTDGLASYYTDAPDIVKNLGIWYPSLGWDLLPYSWLVDWVVSIGNAIERSSFFGRTGVYPIDYCYATYRSTFTVIRSPLGSGKFRWASDNQFVSSSWGACTTTGLYRTRVNPFASASNLSGLSAYQMSILSALGLAHSR
ncbi:maturation protein [ssRNA phage SRR7976325_23]|uniref:Maturation protein n=1 Tax=ssRNA phage SRR7976325_23 TaxID=2786711 RepID=A0A8S5L184_9VIRU|nr:maturation protein [ssRNA phage SRR7976325_23]DAD51188.1 TPA_asm: maturation protein [ssRNA phage SRR7976325_23]